VSRAQRVLNWLLWSRRNLALGIGGAIGGLILLTVIMSSLPSGAPSGTVQVVTGATSSPTASPPLPPARRPSPARAARPPRWTLPPRRPPTPPPWSFVGAWLQGHGGADQATWEKQVQPYAGGEALDGVHAMTREARDHIPAATLATVDVTAASPEGALVTATLNDGTRLALTLSPTAGRWLVTELDKADA
jgi:hypothetical protein